MCVACELKLRQPVNIKFGGGVHRVDGGEDDEDGQRHQQVVGQYVQQVRHLPRPHSLENFDISFEKAKICFEDNVPLNISQKVQ